MLNKILFNTSYYIRRHKVIKFYKEFTRNNLLTIDHLKRDQDLAFVRLIDFCFDHVPYYKDLFRELGYRKDDFRTINDLNKLPILTKAQIKQEKERFIPVNYPIDFVAGSTGGSTGEPLKYRMSVDCYCRGVALLYRGWGFAGYSLGDKVSIIAGASLVSKKKTLKSKAQDFFLNVRHYSSYGMTEIDLDQYIKHIEKWKPLYLRGYASSIYLLAKHIEKENIRLTHKLKGIFSTSEVLTENQRKSIERIFGVKVFDNYGLNDGGLSSFECVEHNGMHIDMERSVFEVVDFDSCSVENKIGKIIATNLHNYAMPLIRYDTGDLGLIDSTLCPCGNQRPLLKQLSGRVTDYLKINNRMIGSPVLTVLMGKINVESYQIIQKATNRILINYVSNDAMSENDRNFIVNSLSSHVGIFFIDFKKVTSGELQSENKFKFIINENFR